MSHSKARHNRVNKRFLEFNYETLEPRQLLTVALGSESGSAFCAWPSGAMSEPAALQIKSALPEDRFTSQNNNVDDSNLVVQLQSAVPMQERMSLLREHLGMEREDSLRLTSLKRDQFGFAHLKYQQYFRGTEVQGGEYTVHIKSRQVVLLSGNFIDVQTTALQPLLTETQALDNAIDFTGADSYLWETPEGTAGDPDGHEGSHAPPVGELVYLDRGDSGTVLTYKFDIYAVAPLSRNFVFVDATSGDIADVHDRIHQADVAADGTSLYNGTVNFTADSFGGSYRLRQVVDTVETYDMLNGTNYNNAVDITSSTTSFTAANVHTGVQAHFGAEQTIQYFWNEHGRDSYDDQGATMLSYVSYDTYYVNAFWDGTRMTYGDGNGSTYNPLVSLDIVGHEVTHGVTETSANLVYAYQSGALNESFSDIFGEVIEFYASGTHDWLMGEDIGSNPGVAFRNMADPPSKGDPDTYQGQYWYGGQGDNGGVHTNSGVQNKWFYILTEGESGINDHGFGYNVTGIGIDDAAAIAYRNLTVYLTSTSQYDDAREGSIQAAIDMFGVNSQQHVSTIDAWDAVGVWEGGQFSLVPVESLGSMVYKSQVKGQINTAGLQDTNFINLDSKQKMSLEINGLFGLIPTVEIRDQANNLIASATGTSSNLVLQNVEINSAGAYQVIVSGDAGSTGRYTLDVFMNAAIETEPLSGPNSSLQTAENIDGSALVQGANPAVDRLAIVGDLSLTQMGDDFETGSLSSDWTTYSSEPEGFVSVTNWSAAAGSSRALFMDRYPRGYFNLNEAILTVDLSTISNAGLSFYHGEWDDETHILPATFTGHYNGDGVSVSEDGVTWHTILTDTDDLDWTYVNYDLDSIAAAAGISLSSNFQIKFQQYDELSYPSDGRAYDEISITTPVLAPDWFEFSVGENQSISVGATRNAGTGLVQVDLYDSSGNLVQVGTPGTNVSSQISQYTNNGPAANYYAVVSGNEDVEYNLVVTRGAAYDLEPNTSTPQDISSFDGVFGYVYVLEPAVAEPDFHPADSILNNKFPGVVLSENLSSGDIYAANASFGAPNGSKVFAPVPEGSDGFRNGENELRADFSTPQSYVSIDVGSDDASDVAWLRAFDSNNIMLEQVLSNRVSSGGRETISISRSSPDIAYVVAAGFGTDVTPLDNLIYQVTNPNDDHFVLAAATDDPIQLDAFLPGSEQYLFHNALDMVMELRDPAGNLVASHTSSIDHVAQMTGIYELRVLASSGAGEYYIDRTDRNNNQAPTDVFLSSNLISENTDTSGGPVEIGTLTASDPDSTSFTYTLVSGSGDTDNGTFEIAGDKLRVKQGVVLDFETQPQYSVRVQVSDGVLTYQKPFLVDVVNQIEIDDIAIGDGLDVNTQRSVINQLVVNFDELVDLAAGAFSLLQRSDYSAATETPVATSYSTAIVGGKTVATITFDDTTRTGLTGALLDGNYQLTVDHTKVTRTGSSETMLFDVVFGDTEDDSFYALFGDYDGDRDIDGLDNLRFRIAYGNLNGSSGYKSAFDYDGDGDIDGIDNLRFRQNYGKSIPFI